MSWRMRVNGGEAVELEANGFSWARLELANMAADTATLQWTRRSVAQVCPITHDDVVSLERESGQVVFVGRARVGSVRQTGCSVRLAGPWAWLEQIIWQQGLSSGAGPAEDPMSIPNAGLFWTSKFWLFEPTGSGYRTVDYQLAELMLWMDVVHPNLIDHGVPALRSPPEHVYDTGDPAAPKRRTVQDISVAEALRMILAVKTDAAVWWDYTTQIPGLNLRIADNETAVEIDAEGPPLVSYDLAVLDELRPAGVYVRWEGSTSGVTGKATSIRLAERAPVDTLTYAPNVLTQTISEPATDLQTGLAAELFRALDRRRSSGVVVVSDPGFRLGLRPGMVLSLSGDAMLEGVQHWVQSVSWVPSTGLATLRIGYPAHLGLRERLDLRAVVRRMFYPANYPSTQV